jgi:hypothetical protein
VLLIGLYGPILNVSGSPVSVGCGRGVALAQAVGGTRLGAGNFSAGC